MRLCLILAAALLPLCCSTPTPRPLADRTEQSPRSETAATPAAPTQVPVPIPAPTRLTVEDAVRLALAHNRTLEVSRLEVEKAKDRVAATQSYYFPSVSVAASEAFFFAPMKLNVDRGELGSIPGLGPLPAKNESFGTSRQFFTTVGALVTQPLSQLYDAYLAVQGRELEQRISEVKHRRESQVVAAEVKKIFYTSLQLESAIRAAEEASTFLNELDRVVARDVDLGSIHASQGLELKARLARQEHDTLALRNGLKTQKERLNGIFGRDLETPIELAQTDVAPSRELDVAKSIALALDHRPEIEEARLKEEAAGRQVDIKRAAFIPQISLSVAYLHQFDLELFPEDVGVAGLTLSWNIFDGGRARRELAEARKTQMQAGIARSETQSQVTVEVAALTRKVEESRSLLRASELGLEAARASLRVAKDKFDQNVLLLKDLLAAQADVARADYQLREAGLSCLTAESELERSLGGED